MTAAVAIGAAVLAALIWYDRPDSVETRPAVVTLPGPRATEPAATPKTESTRGLRDESATAALQQRIADLETALAAAIELRRQAENALDASEREVEELEEYVADIESRGEDPVSYAEAGMERFQPAFFRYQDAAAAYADAAALETAALAALAEAREELAAIDATAAEP